MLCKESYFLFQLLVNFFVKLDFNSGQFYKWPSIHGRNKDTKWLNLVSTFSRKPNKFCNIMVSGLWPKFGIRPKTWSQQYSATYCSIVVSAGIDGLLVSTILYTLGSHQCVDNFFRLCHRYVKNMYFCLTRSAKDH